MRPKPYRRVKYYPAVLKTFEGFLVEGDDTVPQVEHIGKRCRLLASDYPGGRGQETFLVGSLPSLNRMKIRM